MKRELLRFILVAAGLVSHPIAAEQLIETMTDRCSSTVVIANRVVDSFDDVLYPPRVIRYRPGVLLSLGSIELTRGDRNAYDLPLNGPSREIRWFCWHRKWHREMSRCSRSADFVRAYRAQGRKFRIRCYRR